jgi:serine/threonine-protein kinase
MADSYEQVPDTLVAGKYRLTRLLGRGGMGSVWEGVHTSLGARVAVKFIEAEYIDSPEARSRFENEARAAAKLRSKHVVKVFDHGLMADARPYIVMEFLDGEPLDRRLERLGRLDPQQTARILGQVCRALVNAHSVGIVHRDLKPENVFLVWDEEDHADIVKVVDFGIAKFTDHAMGVSSSTRTGSVLGTPYYMSPEQARGLRTVDHRSDLWSLGVIAYRCLVGDLPFRGEAVGDLLVIICTAPLPVPSNSAPDLPAAFDAWFFKALAREPDQRFQNAAELAEALAEACGLSQGVISLPRPSGQALEQPARPVAPAAAQSADPGALTAGPVAQTPPPMPAARIKSRWAVAGAAFAGVALLGVAGAAVLLVGARDAAEEPQAATEVSSNPASVVPTSTAVQPVVAPAASVRPEERPAAIEDAGAAPAQPETARQEAKPVRTVIKRNRPRTQSPAPKSTQTTNSSKTSKGEIDVGY